MTKEEKIQYIYENYNVTECGIIYNRFGNETGKSKDKDGYLKLHAKGSNFSVHRLVAMKFKPNENHEALDVHHIDGDVENNHIDNLEWIDKKSHCKKTREENNVSGEKNPNAKLTIEDVRYIRENYIPRKNGKELMNMFGISKSMFGYIISGKYWKEE